MILNDNRLLYSLLEENVKLYNNADFIKNDPISIPHLFKNKEDIEISAFLTATIAWGNRVSIIKNAMKLIELMENQPYNFILNAEESEYLRFDSFVHRTFNGEDCKFFIHSLKNIYKHHNGLEGVFSKSYNETIEIFESISRFRQMFFSLPHFNRTEKHVSDPARGSAAKRINMFLRWMVRSDDKGVDFGLWKKIPVSALVCPLDLHTGNIARKLGLISRKQNDRKAVEELMVKLRLFDANDPVKYDFALFGMGVNNQYISVKADTFVNQLNYDA